MSETTDDVCGVCNGESETEFVGYAAVPFAPMTIGWCQKCLELGAQPFFQVEALLADHENDMDLLETVQHYGLEVVKEQAISYFLQTNTFYNHEYVLIGKVLERMSDA